MMEGHFIWVMRRVEVPSVTEGDVLVNTDRKSARKPTFRRSTSNLVSVQSDAFGHTLEDQTGLLPRHDEDSDRLRKVFDLISKQSQGTPYLSESKSKQLREYLRIVEDSFGVPRILKTNQASESQSTGLKYLALAYDIVGNTICADLLDYTQRDSLFSSLPTKFDKSIMWYLTVVPETTTLKLDGKQQEVELLRLGVTATRKKLRHDVITSIISLLRARYDLAEKVYYHHAKCAADAMLEKAVHSIGIDGVDVDKFLTMGDERFLEYVHQKLIPKSQTTATSEGYPARYISDLLSRRLFKAAFRITKSSELRDRSRIVQCNEASGRRKAEAEVATACHNLIPSDEIIISCLPEDMQLKEAMAKVKWVDNSIRTLKELAEQGTYAAEVRDLTARYRDLWNLTVYVSSERYNYVPVLVAACEAYFGCSNDPALQSALENDRRIRWDIEKELQRIVDDARRSALQHVASGRRSTEPDAQTLAVEAVKSAVSVREKEEASQRAQVPLTPTGNSEESDSTYATGKGKPGLFDQQDRSSRRPEKKPKVEE